MSDIKQGVFKRLPGGDGLLLDPAASFRDGPTSIHVPNPLTRQYRLVDGATVSGPVKSGSRGLQLEEVNSICELPPDSFQKRAPYTQLTAVDPCDRFRLSASSDASARIIDLIAPIGRGTRAMIVSPPKAGKTTILQEIAKAIKQDAAETRIIALLIDERPEEVTYFRRAVDAEVLASSSDQSVQEHVDLAELTLAHIRTELECGRDVVVLVDSLTRMGRAFNLKGTGRGRTLSGGLEVGALEIPRRFFGLARNIENGGSVTIIATALVDTGSRMDELIFEEFKGTGNCEIVLDRALADSYIFPAINIPKSGTRKETCLYSDEENERLVKLRRALASQEPKEALNFMLEQLQTYKSNDELLKKIPV